MASDERKRVFLNKLKNMTLVKRAWHTKYQTTWSISTKQSIATLPSSNRLEQSPIPRKYSPAKLRNEKRLKTRLESIKENPRLSTRMPACDANICHELARLILRDDLKLSA